MKLACPECGKPGAHISTTVTLNINGKGNIAAVHKKFKTLPISAFDRMWCKRCEFSGSIQDFVVTT